MLTALRPVLSVVEAGVAVAMLVVCYGKAGQNVPCHRVFWLTVEVAARGTDKHAHL